MKLLLQPRLINPPTGDPGVVVTFRHSRRRLLLDLGDNAPLPRRALFHASHAFVSHTHMDHFIGLDRLIRLLAGQERQLYLFGPEPLIAQVGHKLAAYTWNLVADNPGDCVLKVTEVAAHGRGRVAEFHSRNQFRQLAGRPVTFPDHILWEEAAFRVRYARLDHRTPSVAYSLEGARQVNVIKDRLAARGLTVGPWLRTLKQAVLEGAGDSRPIRIAADDTRPLGSLRELVRESTGGKIAYITDTRGSRENLARMRTLAEGADWLFIEAPFLQRDLPLADRTYHLTAAVAGKLARAAGAKRLVPFHFSPRYGDGSVLEAEARAAFTGQPPS